jgi:hypothetical protein
MSASVKWREWAYFEGAAGSQQSPPGISNATAGFLHRNMHPTTGVSE